MNEKLKPLISTFVAILLGLLVGFIIILIANPSQAVKAFSILLRGGFYRGLKSTGQVLYYCVPIMMTGCAVAFAFKCGNFNIGVVGQFTVGAFASIFTVNMLYGIVPTSILWIVGLLASGIAGALWGLIPGLLKAFRNVNIVISGIMFNYMGMYLVIQGVKTFIYDSKGACSQVAKVAIPKMGMNKIFSGSDINGSTIIAILVCILVWIVLNKSTFGYELKASGYNPDASKYAGMSEKRIVVLAVVVSGFLAGLGGGLAYLSGTGKTLSTTEALLDDGFNGIPVALLGMNSPLGCIISSMFIAWLNVGGNYMQSCNVAVEFIDVIIASIIYFSSFALIVKSLLDKYDLKKLKKSEDKGGEES